ncbi:hypothetical protein [Flavobacterium sp.]|uniref:hypothetical protein n=1 Tax=Flavobacterium sp. TaxID=239 RepID=UPI003263D6EF
MKTVKRFIFCLIILSVIACKRDKSFNNKYFTLTVPKEYTIDSINFGEYIPSKFPDRQLIFEKDPSSYCFSFYINNKNFEERKGITLYNTVIKNNLNKGYKEVVFNEIKKQELSFKQGQGKKYKLISAIKDTVIQNQKYTYYIYEYDYLNNTNVKRIKNIKLFTEKNKKIYDIDLKLDSKDNSSLQNQFNELLNIVKTLNLK